MSLGQPNLYIAGNLMQTAKGDPRPALAGTTIKWGTDSRIEPPKASALTAQLLIKGTMPAFLYIGAQVGLTDPGTARTLFAGTIATLRSAPEPSVAGAQRVTLTATSPLAELVKHNVLQFEWPHDEGNLNRWNRLVGTLPAGWTLAGVKGWDWVNQTRLFFATKSWLELLEWYCAGYLMRYHDTSTYVPGAGIQRRITTTEERGKSDFGNTWAPGTRGAWYTGAATTPLHNTATGIAALPASAIGRDIEWEQTFEDSITEVQASTFKYGVPGDGQDVSEWEYPMSYANVDNTGDQGTYGLRQYKIQTSLSAYNINALTPALNNLCVYWLDGQAGWRPTGLEVIDSRLLDTAPMLNLLAVDTRHMAVITVPPPADSPGPIQSYVLAGKATWTGKKWTADLTLGRTL